MPIVLKRLLIMPLLTRLFFTFNYESFYLKDPNAKVIRELREEVETLRMQINQNQERQNVI